MDVNNDNNERAHQEQEEDEEELLQPRIVLLTPEGQQVCSILARKPEELPQYFVNQINELMNDIAAEGEFLPKFRTSVVEDLFVNEEHHRREQQQQKRGLTTTITDKEEWSKEEKRYDAALRLFPGILSEKFNGLYPIQRMVLRMKNRNYNLRLVSLIPLVVKLGIKLQQFKTEERGGLLSPYPIDDGGNALQWIICYNRDEYTTNVTDECFSAVVERLRKENLFITEDIQQSNLFGELCSSDVGSFLASRFVYFIDRDPIGLSMPCEPNNGDFLPIHWSIVFQDIQGFNFLLNEGMKYFPEKFGFVFSVGIQRDSSGRLNQEVPFQEACKKYGQANVMKKIMIHIAEYRSITPTSTMTATATATDATTTTTTTTSTGLSSLLMSAVTDELMHIDCLYILLRNDITTGLLKLQQHLQPQQLEKEEEQTVAKINTDNDNIDSNNKEITGDSTTTTSTSSALENIVATAAIRTISSPTTNKNKKNLRSDIIKYNNNNTHQQSSTKGKKRKQHEMRS